MQDYKVLYAKNALDQIIVRVLFEESRPIAVSEYANGLAYSVIGHIDMLGLLTIRHPKNGVLYSVFYRHESLSI